MGLGTKAAPEGANLDPQREFWSWLRAFLHPGEYGDNHAHERAYFSGFACAQTDPAGMSIRIGGTNTPDSAVLVVAPGGKPVLLSTNGEPELVTIPTAPATGSRIDAVVSYIDTTSPVTDAETPGTPEYVHTIVVQGTAASNPSAPTNEQIIAALPAGAGGTYYRWCDVRVAASQTVITNSDIFAKKPASPNVYLTDGSITTAKLANGAVTSDKIDWTTIKGDPSIPIAIKNTTMMYSVPCILARVGNLVLLQINGFCTGTPNANGSSAETLPVGFRPALNVNTAGYINASDGTPIILAATVNSNGKIDWSSYKTPAKNTYWRFAVTYPTTDDWPS